jgi:hypothetical protein
VFVERGDERIECGKHLNIRIEEEDAIVSPAQKISQDRRLHGRGEFRNVVRTGELRVGLGAVERRRRKHAPLGAGFDGRQIVRHEHEPVGRGLHLRHRRQQRPRESKIVPGGDRNDRNAIRHTPASFALGAAVPSGTGQAFAPMCRIGLAPPGMMVE